MKIAVFGMGYVGMILSACLAKFEHQIIGVDISEDRINKLSSGKSPIFEPRLPELISQGVKNKNLQLIEVPIPAIYTDYSLSKGQGFITGIKTLFRLILNRFV